MSDRSLATITFFQATQEEMRDILDRIMGDKWLENPQLGEPIEYEELTLGTMLGWSAEISAQYSHVWFESMQYAAYDFPGDLYIVTKKGVFYREIDNCGAIRIGKEEIRHLITRSQACPPLEQLKCFRTYFDELVGVKHFKEIERLKKSFS